jgi:hypothetical protein
VRPIDSGKHRGERESIYGAQQQCPAAPAGIQSFEDRDLELMSDMLNKWNDILTERDREVLKNARNGKKESAYGKKHCRPS